MDDHTTMAPMEHPSCYFRAGVGAVILDLRRRVLVLERTDVPGAWQFPQGGLEEGESALRAARREAAEETGLRSGDLRLLASHPTLLAYELPRRMRSPRTGLGQVQYWFYFQTDAVDVPLTRLPPGEFRAARWVGFDRAVAECAVFRLPVYRQLRRFARTLWR
jgi:putative (di)nucleoside polyphosphate hydrolase